MKTTPIKLKRHGLSMAEVVVCTMLVGLVLTASMKSIGSVQQLRLRGQRLLDAQALGQQLLAEVMQQHYEEPDDPPNMGREISESGFQRTDWDDVDDYRGWSSAPEDKDGNSLQGFENWLREVAVDFVQIDDPNTSSLLDTGLKRITVKVTDPDGGYITLQSLRSAWGMLEQPASVNSTVHGYVTNQLQIGTEVPNYAGANVVNHAE